MSIRGLIDAAVVQRLSFGEAPQAIDVEMLRKTVKYHLASMATDGYLVDFGDSHAQRGWDLSTLQAALASTLVRGQPLESTPPALSDCDGSTPRSAQRLHRHAWPEPPHSTHRQSRRR